MFQAHLQRRSSRRELKRAASFVKTTAIDPASPIGSPTSEIATATVQEETEEDANVSSSLKSLPTVYYDPWSLDGDKSWADDFLLVLSVRSPEAPFASEVSWIKAAHAIETWHNDYLADWIEEGGDRPPGRYVTEATETIRSYLHGEGMADGTFTIQVYHPETEGRDEKLHRDLVRQEAYAQNELHTFTSAEYLSIDTLSAEDAEVLKGMAIYHY